MEYNLRLTSLHSFLAIFLITQQAGRRLADFSMVCRYSSAFCSRQCMSIFLWAKAIMGMPHHGPTCLIVCITGISSMLEYLAASGLPSLLPPVYDVLKTLKPEFDPELDQRPIWYLRDDRAMEQQRHLRIFRYAIHDRPDIIEGIDSSIPDISQKRL
jgi:hypothetical protein